jgi:serine/threonine-protein kinase
MADHQDRIKGKETAIEIVADGWQCAACGMQLAHSVLACPNDGTHPAPPIDSDPQFSGFEFIGMIGSGGMGVIYKARQIALNKLVAIKMLHPYLLSPEAVRRFQLEGQAVNKLDHPYIIKVHNFGLSQRGPFMIMDYVDGKTLTEVVQADGPLPLERVLAIFIQSCDALAHAHKRGVLHRDLKPSNLMLRKNYRDEEEVCIMDFGIAKLIDDATTSGAMSRITRTGETIGSPLYMSPEQARSAPVVDARSDVYSLGCVMYEALTGAPPLQGNNPLETMMMHVSDKPLSLSQSLLGARRFDPRIETVIERLLQKEPDRRYQSMDELKTHLIAIQDGKKLGQLVYKPPAPKGERAKIVLAACGILALIAFAVIFVGMHDVGIPTAKSSHAETPRIDLPTIKSMLTDSVTAGNTIIAPQSGDVSDDDLAPLESAYKVEEIELKRSEDLTSKGLMHLSQLPNLKTLDLSWCPRITDLSPLRSIPKLKSLTLCSDNIGDGELEELRGLSLETLDLTGTQVSNLDALRTMHSLEHLGLGRTPIGHQALKNVGSLKNLKYLDLSSTSVSDSDLQYIALPKLQHLLLCDCDNLSQSAVSALKTKLSHSCGVRFSHTNKLPPAGRSPVENATDAVQEGNNLIINGYFDEAISMLSRTLQQLKKQQPPALQAIEMCESLLAKAKRDAKKSHDLPGALKLIDDSIAILERDDAVLDTSFLPDHYYLKGTICAALKKNRESYDAFAKSEKLYEDTNEQFSRSSLYRPREIARAEDLKALGIYDLNISGDFSRAQEELEKAYGILHEFAPVRALVCCHALGSVYWRQSLQTQDQQKRKSLLLKALAQFQQEIAFLRSGKAGDVSPEAITEAQMMLGDVLIYLGREEEAEKVLKPLLKTPCSPRLRVGVLDALLQISRDGGRRAEVQQYEQERSQIKL